MNPSKSIVHHCEYVSKVILYNNGTKNTEFRDLVKNQLRQDFITNSFVINVANNTFHSSDREKQRFLSEDQRETIAAIRNSSIYFFSPCEISEIRGFQIGNQFHITGLVINDVVFAVHSKGLPRELINMGYGTAEGEGFAVIKTVLKYPNREPACHVGYVDSFKIIKGDDINTFAFNNKKNK